MAGIRSVCTDRLMMYHDVDGSFVDAATKLRHGLVVALEALPESRIHGGEALREGVDHPGAGVRPLDRTQVPGAATRGRRREDSARRRTRSCPSSRRRPAAPGVPGPAPPHRQNPASAPRPGVPSSHWPGRRGQQRRRHGAAAPRTHALGDVEQAAHHDQRREARRRRRRSAATGCGRAPGSPSPSQCRAGASPSSGRRSAARNARRPPR